MKCFWKIGFLFCLSLLAGCNGNKPDTTDSPKEITDEPLKQQEEAVTADTTLQEVEKFTIRTQGGEDLQSMTFDTETLHVKAGALVRLELINESSDPKMIYNIVFTKEGYSWEAAREGSQKGAPGNYLPDSAIMIAASPLALPGQTVNMEFTAPVKPGTYDFLNTYPNESEKLKGKMIVK